MQYRNRKNIEYLAASTSSLVKENRLVFMRGGPRKQSQQPATPDPGQEAMKDIARGPERGQRGPTMQVASQQVKTITEHIAALQATLKGKLRTAGTSERGKIGKRLARIKQVVEMLHSIRTEIETIVNEHAKNKTKIYSNYNDMIRTMAFRLLPAAARSRLAAQNAARTRARDASRRSAARTRSKTRGRPGSGRTRPNEGGNEAAGETVETVPSGLKGKMIASLDKIRNGDVRVFNLEAAKLQKYIAQLQQLNFRQFHKKPNTPGFLRVGNYTITVTNYTKTPTQSQDTANAKPNLVISFGPRLICYRHENGHLVHSSQARDIRTARDQYARNIAEQNQARGMLHNEFSNFSAQHGKFLTEGSLRRFVYALRTLARTSIGNGGGATWALNFHINTLHASRIKFYRLKGSNGYFVMKIAGKTIKINTGKIKINQLLKKYVLTARQRTDVKRRRAIKGTAKILKQKQTLRNKAKARIATRALTTFERSSDVNERSRNLSQLLNTKLIGSLKDRPGKTIPCKFKLTAKTKAGNKKIEAARIDQLLNFKELGNNVVYVKIGKKTGMYYPGQKSCYVVRGGRQTAKRLSIHKGDEVEIKTIRPPATEDYKLLSKRARKSIKDLKAPKLSAAQMKAERMHSRTVSLLVAFYKTGAKFRDLAKMSGLGKDPALKSFNEKRVKFKRKHGANWSKPNIFKLFVAQIKPVEWTAVQKALKAALTKLKNPGAMTDKKAETLAAEQHLGKHKKIVAKSLSQLSLNPKIGIGFTSKDALKAFTSSLVVLANSPYIASMKFPLTIGKNQITFNKAKKIFSFKVRNVTMRFDANKPNYLQLPNPNKPMPKAILKNLIKGMNAADRRNLHRLVKTRPDYWSWPTRLLVLKGPSLKEYNAAKKKQAEVAARTARSEARETSARTMLDGLERSPRTEALVRGKKIMGRLLPKRLPRAVRGHLIQSPGNPYQMIIKAPKNTRSIRRLKRLRVKQLLNFKKVPNTAFYVTIKGPGTRVKKGLYYPGQSACWEVDSKTGVQKRTRIKFTGNCTMTVRPVSPPTNKEFNSLRTDTRKSWSRRRSVKRRREGYAKLVLRQNLTQAKKKTATYLTKFRAFQGKVDDLKVTPNFGVVKRAIQVQGFTLTKMINDPLFVKNLSAKMGNSPGCTKLLTSITKLVGDTFKRIGRPTWETPFKI